MVIVKTRKFGEIGIDERKVISFPRGLIGYPELTRFAMIHDKEKLPTTIYWLQSLDNADFALPVVDPLLVCKEYNPCIKWQDINDIGDLTIDNIDLLVTMSIPKNLENMTVNLKAPIVINTKTMKALQVIIANDDYPIKKMIYEYLTKKGDDV